MNSKQIKKYKDIAHLNKEANLCLATLGLPSGDPLVGKNKIILTLHAYNEDGLQETEEWTGFVQTIKVFIKRHLASTNDNIDNSVKQIKSEMKTIKDDLSKEMGDIKTMLAQIQNKIN